MTKILIINGPNLNLLGTREPDIYGAQDLSSLCHELEKQADELGHQLIHFQSNAEHELIDTIHQAPKDGVAFIIINPAGLTHTSVVLRDALLAVQIPFIEVHLSNIFGREPFRRKSFFSDIAKGVISGLGTHGYELALQAADRFLKEDRETNK